MTPNDITTAWKQALAKKDRRPIYEWAHEHVILPSMYAQAGRFSVESSRYMIEPFQALADPYCREVDICKAIQTGGTITSELACLYWIANDPGPIMWTFQTDEDGKEHCKSRWNPLLNGVDAVKRILPKERYAQGTTEIYFGPFFLIVNGANISSLQSKSIRYKINDEVWIWRPGLLAEAKGRVSAFESARISKFVCISQAGKAESDWEHQWLTGSRKDWGFRCSCNKIIPLLREFKDGENRAGLVWDFDAKDENGFWNVARCAETARFRCPECGKEWEDSDKTRAYWNKWGQYVRPEDAKETRIHEGYRWNALVNRDMSLLVEEFVEAENAQIRGTTTPMEECLQKRFSEFTSEETFAEEVEIQQGSYSLTDYFDGSVQVDGEVARLMTIDRQQDHYYYVARAYRNDGSNRLISAGRTQTKEQLRDIQLRLGIQDFCVGLDSSYETDDCYKICAQYNWLALEGSEGAQEWSGFKDKKKRFFSPHQRHQTPHGTCNRHLFGGERIKDMLGRMREQPKFFETPNDPPADYIHSISMSEAKKQIIHPKTGRIIWKWIRITRKNHYFDCEVMLLAMAMIKNLIRSIAGSEKTQEAPQATAPAPETFVEQVRKSARRPVATKKSWVTRW